ncbi:carboxypeptidase regulatory-like domain-containing protein [Planctomycetota bacterium]
MDELCDTIQKRLVKLHLTNHAIQDDPEVQAHLETCANCRIYLDYLVHDHDTAEDHAESLDSYAAYVKTKLHHHHDEEITPSAPKPHCLPGWLCGLGVLLVIVLILILAQPPQPSVPVVTKPLSPQAPSPSVPVTPNETNASAPASSSTPAPLRVLVTDYQTGQALPGAWIIADLSGQGTWRGASDANGWGHIDFTERALSELSMRVGKPGYVPMNVDYSVTAKTRVPIEIPVALKPGLSIGGFVQDGAGKPIPAARVRFQIKDVRQADLPYVSLDYDQRTDAQGRWTCDAIPDNCQALTLSVTHPEYTVLEQEVVASNRTDPNGDAWTMLRRQDLVLTLQPGQTLRGYVVDVNGIPLAGARVSAALEPERSVPIGQATTDANGVYTMKSLPADTVTLRIAMFGYMPYVTTLRPVEKARHVLFPILQVTGTVVDAENGEAIEQFFVVPGTYRSSTDAIHWDEHPQPTQEQTGGKLQHTFDSPHEGYALFIEAEGYLPVTSRTILPGARHVKLHITMNRGTGLPGMVVDLNNRLQPDVPIYAAFTAKAVLVQDGVVTNTEAARGHTDAAGRFVLNPQPNMSHVVAVSSYGIGSATLDEFTNSGTVVLEPWATVQGDLFIGSHPAPNQLLELTQPDDVWETYGYWCSHMVETDSGGLFAFNQVAPGRIILYHQEHEILPGETLDLHLGGTGRTLVARFTIPNLRRRISWRALEVSIVRLPYEQSSVNASVPASLDRMDLTQLQDWAYEQLLNEPPEQVKWQYLQPDLGGRVLYDNLEPGRYALAGSLTRDRQANPTEQLARLWYGFEVPEISDASLLDEPIDLGVIPLIPGDLELGSVAPNFNLRRLNRRSLRLTDLAGRFALLSFYGAEQLITADESLSTLITLQEQFAENERLVVIGMLSSEQPASVDYKLITLTGLTWPHVRVGPPHRNPVHIAYDVLGNDWPWNILVSPEGTILSIGLQGEELIDTVANLLAQ